MTAPTPPTPTLLLAALPVALVPPGPACYLPCAPLIVEVAGLMAAERRRGEANQAAVGGAEVRA